MLQQQNEQRMTKREKNAIRKTHETVIEGTSLVLVLKLIPYIPPGLKCQVWIRLIFFSIVMEQIWHKAVELMNSLVYFSFLLKRHQYKECNRLSFNPGNAAF